MRHPARDDGGFTLLELLIVLIIIGLLSAIAVPSFLRQRGKAYTASARSALRSLATAEEAALAESGTYAAIANLPEYQVQPSPDIDLVLISGEGSATRFCASGKHIADDLTWYFDSSDGGLLDAGQTCS